MARKSYISTRGRWWPRCTLLTCLVGFLILLVHWNNSLRVDMSLHLDTLS